MLRIGPIRHRLNPRAEDGIALVLALTVLVFFSIATATAVTMATSTQGTTTGSTGQQTALELAEAGINSVESTLNYQITSGGNPSAANLLGCNGATGPNDVNGPSNCTTPAPLLLCVTTPSCTAGTAGTVSVFGYFAGTNSGSYGGATVPASSWLIVSTGYSAGPSSTVITRRRTATIMISPLGSGAIASVWNHIFLTAPLVAGVCQTDISGANTILDAPIYMIGNLCFSGANTSLQEAAGGQHIDLMVGGKLILNGANSEVGQGAGLPITSGVVVGGCNATGVTFATVACAPAGRYWVTTPDTFLTQDDPEMTTAQTEINYRAFDLGPMHTCLAGTVPSPLADNQFDWNIAANEGTSVAPDTSGSGSAGGAFELAPAASYACISKNGTGTGYLIWNNGGSSLTVSGITVPSKTLAISGNIFFDSNVTISQSVTYMGTGVVEAAGSVTINGNNVTVCATGTSCTFSSWQGNTGNNSMLTLASLQQNATSINLNANNQTFQGSIWGRPSSKMSFSGNNAVMEGPIAIGSVTVGNNTSFKPLPVIKNMPTGAPVPPNTSASVGAPAYTG